MTMSDSRILALEGVNNFRDYGDYAVSGGGRVRRGVLWRSGQHVAATDADLETIDELALATVTDLRGDSERTLNPCRRHATFTAQVLTCDGETAELASHIDAAQGVLSEDDARQAMRRLYAGMPYRPNLVAVLRRHFAALAAGGGASLVHCFAGKDRTGLSVALTHYLLGVHPDDAMADYLLTNAAMAGRQFRGNAGQGGARYAGLSEAASRALGGVDPSYLEAGFAAIRASHGSLDAYLEQALGIDRAALEAIRANYLKG
jgi:protein tyrosine/serine phosphatase